MFPKFALLKRWDAAVPVSCEAPSQVAPGRDTEPNSRAAGLLQQVQVLHSLGDKQTWAEKLQGQVQEQCWYHQTPRGTGEPIRACGHIPWGGKKHVCLGRAFCNHDLAMSGSSYCSPSSAVVFSYERLNPKTHMGQRIQVPKKEDINHKEEGNWILIHAEEGL